MRRIEACVRAEDIREVVSGLVEEIPTPLLALAYETVSDDRFMSHSLNFCVCHFYLKAGCSLQDGEGWRVQRKP